MTSPTLCLVQWNLNGLCSDRLDERTEWAVGRALLGRTLEDLMNGLSPRPLPDVLTFQEVTARMFHAHLRPHLSAAGFEIYPSTPPAREAFEVIAVRRPWTIIGTFSEPLYGSTFGRWLHRVDLQGPASLSIFTAHFDSGPDASSARHTSLLDLSQQMNRRSPSLFAGDVNLRDTEWEGRDGRVELEDAWENTGANAAHRWTWQDLPRRARFDRVWSTRGLHASQFETFGWEPQAFGLASDHAAIRVSLRIQD